MRAEGHVESGLIEQYAIIDNLSDLLKHEEDWERLLLDTRCDRAFASFQWFYQACATFPVRAQAFFWRKRGKLKGILPLVLQSDGTLTFATPLADHHDLICRARDRIGLARVLAQVLNDYSRFVLYGFRSDSNLGRALATLLPKAEWRLLYSGRESPHVRLPTSYAWYLAGLSKKLRGQLRLARNRMERSGMRIWQLTPHNFPANDLADLFLRLHLRRLGEKSTFVESPRNALFVQRVFPLLFASGRLTAFVVGNDDAILAMTVFMDGPKTLGAYNSGFDEAVAFVSPGILLLDAGIQFSIAAGKEEFNLMGGNRSYKARFANGTRILGGLAHFRDKPLPSADQ